ncbi:MAG TPA: hypothetical protein VMN58_02480 [Acidimicrobiales bacterium]|nr:hypothetical protein [Acidimicrobiales bacterium]
MRGLLDRLSRRVTGPVRTHVDERTTDVHRHLDEVVEHQIGPRIDRRVDRVEDRVADIQERVTAMQGSVDVDVQVATEAMVTIRRTSELLRQEMDGLLRILAPQEPTLPALIGRSAAGDAEADLELARLLVRMVPAAADRVAGELVGTDLDAMGPGLATLLNWAGGHTSPSGQAAVWFNPPVTVLHEPGSVRTNEVNERIVEIPYAFAAVAGLPTGSLVLDFGAAESTIALSLASLGLEVLAADLRPHPFAHPGITAVTGPIERWAGPPRPLDAVLCISALEHVGLGAYDEEPTDGDLDHTILSLFGQWLRPGGELTFTAPYGRWERGEQQRVYDEAHLVTLFEGWTIVDRRTCAQTGPATWEPVGGDGPPPSSRWDDGTRGVVLLRATPPT